MSAVAMMPPLAAVTTPTPERTCRNCRRSGYDPKADTLRCDERKAPPLAGVIYVGVTIAKRSGVRAEREYEKHCREVAGHCKFYQEQA